MKAWSVPVRPSSRQPTTRAARITSRSPCCSSMWSNLATLVRYRGLVQSLVVRDLKARYRGSVLGFFWSFVNPLLLLSIYTFVFSYILVNDEKRTQPYSVFMFCGLLPWTWFAASLTEACG